ncbi:MAG: glycine dehydrogenase, partial [Anaerolineae bacterium]|nr:glycine dehydrogenase [Anaerolineae bacterium]
MSYIPLTGGERADMLSTIGVSSVEQLFTDVPERHRYPPIHLPPPQSELEVMRDLRALSEMNAELEHCVSFLGAGAYQHAIPSVVNHVLLRSEFYTAYTPYQPEVSQGTLQ